MVSRPLSLRARLLGSMGLVFLIGMVALYAAASSYARLAADRSYDRLLSGAALSIAETLTVSASSIRVDIPYAALDMLAAAPDDRVFYRVIAPNGSTVTGYDDLPSYADLAETKAQAEGSVAFYDAGYLGEPVRFVLLGRESTYPGQSGWIWVQVGQTRTARDALAQELLIRALVPIIFMTVLALAVIWFSIGRALGPLNRIGSHLVGRQSADLSAIEEPVPGEIGPLVSAMNGFMLRLEANMNLLRSFIANAAHQLRTPLAALLVQIQSAEKGGEVDRAHSLKAANRSAKRLARLVDQLLSEAMVGHRSDLKRFAPFDLKKVVAQAVRETVPMAEDTDVRFSSALAEAPYLGDSVMIGEAVKNLIHNALVHGRNERGEVVIDLSRNGSEDYCLSVKDRGPGISEADLANLYDRFKPSSGAAGGAGLGLSIVRQVVESHGGQLHVENRETNGLMVQIRLPLP